MNKFKLDNTFTAHFLQLIFLIVLSEFNKNALQFLPVKQRTSGQTSLIWVAFLLIALCCIKQKQHEHLNSRLLVKVILAKRRYATQIAGNCFVRFEAYQNMSNIYSHSVAGKTYVEIYFNVRLRDCLTLYFIQSIALRFVLKGKSGMILPLEAPYIVSPTQTPHTKRLVL
jgi:hypothetical protein